MDVGGRAGKTRARRREEEVRVGVRRRRIESESGRGRGRGSELAAVPPAGNPDVERLSGVTTGVMM